MFIRRSCALVIFVLYTSLIDCSSPTLYEDEDYGEDPRVIVPEMLVPDPAKICASLKMQGFDKSLNPIIDQLKDNEAFRSWFLSFNLKNLMFGTIDDNRFDIIDHNRLRRDLYQDFFGNRFDTILGEVPPEHLMQLQRAYELAATIEENRSLPQRRNFRSLPAVTGHASQAHGVITSPSQTTLREEASSFKGNQRDIEQENIEKNEIEARKLQKEFDDADVSRKQEAKDQTQHDEALARGIIAGERAVLHRIAHMDPVAAARDALQQVRTRRWLKK